MARMPGAEWIGPTPNIYPGGMIAHNGLVLHIQDGNEAGSEAWFKNSQSEASAHFLNPKSGGLRQLVDTDDAAWTEMAGNRTWVSVENEGLAGDILTPSQIENCAQLLAWLNKQYKVPLTLTNDVTGFGLGWHGMGGAAWGGHYDCPGTAILAQRPAIIARTQEIVNGPTKPPVNPPPTNQGPSWPGLNLSQGSTGIYVREVQQRLADRKWSITVDGDFGPKTKAVVVAFQNDSTAHGWPLTADGIVGKLTWQALWNRPVS